VREIPDEILMAYADGEVSADWQQDVETYLATDPNAQQRLQAFARTGRDLGQLFDRPMREGVPEHLVAFVRDAPGKIGAHSANSSAQVLVYPTKAHAAPARLSGGTWAIAASVVLLSAIGAGTLFYRERGRDLADASSYGLERAGDGSKVAGAVLAAALETTPSGKIAVRTMDADQASIRPSFTFRSAKGEYCRQYEVHGAKAGGLAGVACREGAGAWRVEVQTASADRHGDSGAIIPAGKESSQAVDAVVDRLISGDVLGQADEASAISGGWGGAKP
jgi:hypothetical protein